MTDNTNLGLSPIELMAYNALLDEKYKLAFLNERRDLKRTMIRGCIAQVMARNTSHNVMGHVFLKAVKGLKTIT